MTEEQIVRLAALQREYDYTCANGWVLRIRIPERERIRRVVRSLPGDLDGAADQLAMESVVSWQGVTLEDAGCGDLAGVKPTDPAPCVPQMVRMILGDRLSILDALASDFMTRVAERHKTLQADEKNSVSA